MVIASPDAAAWVQLLRAAGYAVQEGSLATMTARSGGVVPGDTVLSASQISGLDHWVHSGGRIATSNPALLETLGVRYRKAALVSAATMKTMNGVAHWATPLRLLGLVAKNLTVLATSNKSGLGVGGTALMGSLPVGAGLVVAMAVDPVGGGREGFELLPRAAALVGTDLGAPIGPQLEGAEIFVDPGGLPKSLESDPAAVANLLAEAGARVAEIAAWDYDFSDRANDLNYERYINAMHARGILAYAWLEPPFVTLAMWQAHPECREKTETGRDAYVGWRSLIALEDPRCMALAKKSWESVLTKYPWDGVNVAELYFEPASQGANNYTPFSAAALRLFGKNPATNPAAFARFRTTLVTELNQEMLDFLNGLPNAKNLGLELTVIDNSLDPAAGAAVGSDVAALARVASRGGASLVVEDPTATWTEGPLRYNTLGPHVKSLMPPSTSLIDVNVIARAGALPTSKMTGSELELAVASATKSLGRVAIYSLGTMSDQDISEIPGAMGASATVTDKTLDGTWTVKVTAPSSSDNRLTVDGIQWPAAGDSALVPAGFHRLIWSQGSAAGPGLVSFTDELGTASVSKSLLLFSYYSHSDALAVLTARPTELLLDGTPATLSVLPDPAGGFVIRMPAGTHQAVIEF